MPDKKYTLKHYSISGESFIANGDTLKFSEIDEIKSFTVSRKWRKFVGYPLTILGGGATGLSVAAVIAIAGAIEPIAIPFAIVIFVGPPLVAFMLGLETLQVSRRSIDMNRWRLVVENDKYDTIGTSD